MDPLEETAADDVTYIMVPLICSHQQMPEELIPESHREGNVDLATVSLMAGFVVMMVLDVSLG